MTGGTEATFAKDLEQSWRLYQFHALVFNLSWRLDDKSGQRVRSDVLDLIQEFPPRCIWLYVKHFRCMFSDEYAVLQETYIGTAPIYIAKSKALVAQQIEDEVVRGELLHGLYPFGAAH